MEGNANASKAVTAPVSESEKELGFIASALKSLLSKVESIYASKPEHKPVDASLESVQNAERGALVTAPNDDASIYMKCVGYWHEFKPDGKTQKVDDDAVARVLQNGGVLKKADPGAALIFAVLSTAGGASKNAGDTTEPSKDAKADLRWTRDDSNAVSSKQAQTNAWLVNLDTRSVYVKRADGDWQKETRGAGFESGSRLTNEQMAAELQKSGHAPASLPTHEVIDRLFEVHFPKPPTQFVGNEFHNKPVQPAP